MLRIIRGFKTQAPSPLEKASDSVPGSSVVMLNGLGSDLETPPAQAGMCMPILCCRASTQDPAVPCCPLSGDSVCLQPTTQARSHKAACQLTPFPWELGGRLRNVLSAR